MRINKEMVIGIDQFFFGMNWRWNHNRKFALNNMSITLIKKSSKIFYNLSHFLNDKLKDVYQHSQVNFNNLLERYYQWSRGKRYDEDKNRDISQNFSTQIQFFKLRNGRMLYLYEEIKNYRPEQPSAPTNVYIQIHGRIHYSKHTKKNQNNH